MFSALALTLWGVQFVLETAGALSLRRRLKPLAWFLAYRAAADLLGFILYRTAGMTALQWSDYLQRMIQYPMLCWLALVCVGAAFGEERRTVKPYCLGFSVVLACGLVIAHGAMEWNLSTVLWIEEKTVFAIAVILISALIMREFQAIEAPMDRDRVMMAAGLLVLLISDGVLTIARERRWLGWNSASVWIQAGQITALAIWAGAGLRGMKWPEWKKKLRTRVAIAGAQDDFTLAD